MITSIVLIIVAIIALLIYVSAVIRKRPKHPNRISAHVDSPQKGQSGLVVTTTIDESLIPKGNPRNANALDSITKEKTIVPGLDTKSTGTTSTNSYLNQPTDSNKFNSSPRLSATNGFTQDPFTKETVANRSTYSNTNTVSGSDFSRTHQPTHLSAHKSAKPTVATSNPFADANSALQIDSNVNPQVRADMGAEPRTPFLSSPNLEYSNSTKESASNQRLDQKLAHNLPLDDLDYVDFTQVNLTTSQDVLDANPSLKAYETNTNWGQATKSAQQTYRKHSSSVKQSSSQYTQGSQYPQGSQYAQGQAQFNSANAKANTNANANTNQVRSFGQKSERQVFVDNLDPMLDPTLSDARDLDVDLDEDYSYNPHGNDSRKSYFSQVKTVEGTADPSQVENFDFDHKTTYEQLVSQTLPEDKIDDHWLSDYHYANSANSLERPKEQELSLEQERELARPQAETPRRRPVAPAPNTDVNEEAVYDDLMRQLEQELNNHFVSSQKSNSRAKATPTVSQTSVDYNGVNPIDASSNGSTSGVHAQAKTNSNTFVGSDQALAQTLQNIKQQIASDPQALALLLSQLEKDKNLSSNPISNSNANSNANNYQATGVNTNQGNTAQVNSVAINTNSINSGNNINNVNFDTHTQLDSLATSLFTNTQASSDKSNDSSHVHTITDFKLPSLEEETEFSTATDLDNLVVINDLPTINDGDSFEEVVTKSIISSKPEPHVGFFEEEASIVNLFHNLKKGQSIDNYLIFKLFPMRSKVFSHDSIINFLRRHDSEFTLNNTNKSFLSYYDYYTSDSEKKKLVLYEIFTDKGPFSTDYSEYSYLLVLIDKRIFANSNDNFLSILLSRLHAMTVDLKGDLYWREQLLKKDSVSYSTGQFRKYIAQLTTDPMLEEFL